jgi:predicted N-acetyltransferase YhbS
MTLTVPPRPNGLGAAPPAASPPRDSPPGNSPLELRAERPEDGGAAQALIDRAFGPGRFAKTAERVREHAGFRPDLSVCARFEGALVGVVRMWDVTIGARPAILLGPIAVDPAFRHHGLGADLVAHACAAATAAGDKAVVLVGDLGFFGPLGFAQVPAGRIDLGGPVDPGRLFWKALAPGALDGLAGVLTGAPQA